MPAPTLTKIETRRLRASPERQAAIADALGANVDELFAPLAEGPNAERNRTIAADYAGGVRMGELEKRYKLDRSVLGRIIDAEGVKRVHGADAATIEKACALYLADEKPSGLTVAAALKAPASNVYYWLEKAGVPRRLSTWFHAVPERHWRWVLRLHEGREKRSCTISAKSKRRAKYALAGVLASPPGTRRGGRQKGYSDAHVNAARVILERDPKIGRARLARLLSTPGKRVTEEQARAIKAVVIAETTG